MSMQMEHLPGRLESLAEAVGGCWTVQNFCSDEASEDLYIGGETVKGPGKAQVAGARTCRQSSPDLTMMGRTAQPGRRPCGDCACTRRALSAKRSPYTARACAAAASASVAAAESAACAVALVQKRSKPTCKCP